MAARPSAQEADRSEVRKDPIGVLVALEVPLLRLGVQAAVDAAGDCRVVGVVSSEEEVVPAVARTRPDVVVLDTDYHRREPDLIGQITETHDACAVLVLVNHSDEECVVRSMLSRTNAVKLTPEAYGRLNECCLLALRSSARGCAPKVGDPERLLAAIRTVAAGEVAAGPWLDALVLQSRSEPAYTETGRRISARELDVITLVARGLENKEIARQLGIREQTVKNHLGRVMKKLGLRNRQELAVFAVKQHLVHMSWSP